METPYSHPPPTPKKIKIKIKTEENQSRDNIIPWMCLYLHYNTGATHNLSSFSFRINFTQLHP